MRDDGCIIGTRIIYAAEYRVEDGRTITVCFDRSGNDINGFTVHSDHSRRVITTRAGETILYRGEPLKVVKAGPDRQSWLTAEDRAKYMK